MLSRISKPCMAIESNGTLLDYLPETAGDVRSFGFFNRLAFPFRFASEAGCALTADSHRSPLIVSMIVHVVVM